MTDAKSASDARTLEADLRRLQAGAADAKGQVDRLLHRTVSSAPLLAVGAAAGLGFILGGGLPRGAIGVLFGIGARMTSAWVEQQFLEHNQE